MKTICSTIKFRVFCEAYDSVQRPRTTLTSFNKELSRHINKDSCSHGYTKKKTIFLHAQNCYSNLNNSYEAAVNKITLRVFSFLQRLYSVLLRRVVWQKSTDVSEMPKGCNGLSKIGKLLLFFTEPRREPSSKNHTVYNILNMKITELRQ